jgi:hypothetical protein
VHRGSGTPLAGIGKITHPLAQAEIAGTGNLVQPRATGAAVPPALLFLTIDRRARAFAFIFLAVETHERAMALGPEEEPAASARPASGPAE